ncbi:hypothetical protein B7494_g1710 [Chlorociboria aeruginascens]|nr:hypothetical protein B7494_g1710 [Chlorociboria aeruginascens]
MNKRQFKSQASSGRASAAKGFDVFGSNPKDSTLSFISEPPDLSSITDSNVVVAFKNLSKKDDTTKSKALEGLRAYVKNHPYEDEHEIEEPILEAYVKIYPRICIDKSRRVRELSHLLLSEFLQSARKRMEKYIPQFVGSWVAGANDQDRAAAGAARDGIKSLLGTDEKVNLFWKRCHVWIVDYALEAVNETPHTLSDKRIVSSEDSKEKYDRVIISSMALLIDLLTKLDKDQIAKHQDKYEELLSGNKRLWALVAKENPVARRATCNLLVTCLDKQDEIIEMNLELISSIFITEALRCSQSTSAWQLVEALQRLTSRYPHVWTLNIDGRSLSLLCNFVEKGSQGGPSQFWKTFGLLVSTVPLGVLPTDIKRALKFTSAFHKGITNRQEPRTNSAEAWTSYIETVGVLADNLSNSSLAEQIFRESVFPIFKQFVHPATEDSQWSVSNNTVVLAKGYIKCASRQDSGLQESLQNYWEQLAQEFAESIYTQSGNTTDYDKLQISLREEGRRWFYLFSKLLEMNSPDDSVHHLMKLTETIVNSAIKSLIDGVGTPYSAAAILTTCLELTPSLVAISPSSLRSITMFLQNNLPLLITTPSSVSLILLLNLFRSLPNQEVTFKSVWQDTFDALLSKAEKDSSNWKVMAALISNEAVRDIAKGSLKLQDYLLGVSSLAVKGDSEAWKLFEAAAVAKVLTLSTEMAVLGETLAHLDDRSRANITCAFDVLEILFKTNPELLAQQNDAHIALTGKLLSLSEISNTASDLAIRATQIRTAMGALDTPSDQLSTESPIVHIIRENLETATEQSLTIDTLSKQAMTMLRDCKDLPLMLALCPDPTRWVEAIYPLLKQTPNPTLGTMGPFAGAVFLACESLPEPIRPLPRDLNGFSVGLRMAMYAAYLVTELFDRLPSDYLVEVIYLMGLTTCLVCDQIDLDETDKLFSGPKPNAMVMQFLESLSPAISTHMVSNAKLWRNVINENKMVEDNYCSLVAQKLVTKLIQEANGSTPTALYAARVLADLLEKLVQEHGWNSVGGEDWLASSKVLETNTSNVLGQVAILIGLQDHLKASKTISHQCNKLISDVSGASSQSESTLSLVVLLNASLSVYNDGEFPVAQNRLVFAVKQILSWTKNLATSNAQLSAEACRALQKLLPAIRSVYGSYWNTSLEFCLSIWSTSATGYNSDEQLAMIGMSLKLFAILKNLKDANDDLEDALKKFRPETSLSLIRLLKASRSKETQPQQFVDDILSRLVMDIPSSDIKDRSEFYPLVASNIETIQSAAFDILHKALPEAQKQISVDVLLEKKDAKLPDELLSLLLDAPSIHQFDDEELATYPSAVRGYLLSWHLVYDSYINASYKVRNDYSTNLRTDDYIKPLLDFIFDVLVDSRDNPLKLEDYRLFDASHIETFDMREAITLETNESSMQWLLINLYYLCLKYTPSLAKNCNDEKELSVRIARKSSEIFASYEVDEEIGEIAISLPPSYPLEGVKVRGVARVAASEKKWKSWLMITQGVITFSNGSITDGLVIFRKNLAGALKEQTECAICYSIVSSDKRMPEKRCGTCQNLFHTECLFKWFASSNQSSCPLCRNPFVYSNKKVPRDNRAVE